MANNYLQFSEQLISLSKEESEWIALLAFLASDKDDPDHYDDDRNPTSDMAKLAVELFPEESYIYTEVFGPQDDGTYSVWFQSEECDDPEAVGTLVQAFLKKFRHGQNISWPLTWAETCSKSRVGEFAGGAMLVTEDNIFIKHTNEIISEWQGLLESGHKHLIC